MILLKGVRRNLLHEWYYGYGNIWEWHISFCHECNKYTESICKFNRAIYNQKNRMTKNHIPPLHTHTKPSFTLRLFTKNEKQIIIIKKDLFLEREIYINTFK